MVVWWLFFTKQDYHALRHYRFFYPFQLAETKVIMNNKQQHQKFKIAVYITILSFAFVFLVISFIVRDDFMRNLLMNIGTDLLGVTLLFFIVNKFFGLDTEDSFSERLEVLIGILERRVNILNDRDEGSKKYQLATILQTAQDLDVIGWNLPNLLQEFYEPIIKRVQAGVTVRILIIDPTSLARDLIYQNTVMYDFDSLTQRAIKYIQIIQDRLKADSRKTKGTFEFRVINWIPSCSVTIANKNLPSGSAKVDVYSLHYRIPAREGGLNFVLQRSEHPQWFEYYVNQFEKAWERGTPFHE